MLWDGGAAPDRLVHSAFTARPLTTNDVDLDYAAYVASPDVIRRHSDGRWPVEGFTRAEDHELIATHEADHRAGRAFTFLLLEPGEEQSLGCLYLNPLAAYLKRVDAPAALRERFGRAAMVTFWLRQDLENVDPRQDLESIDLGQDLESIDLGQDVEKVNLRQDAESIDLRQDLENVDLRQDVENVDLVRTVVDAVDTWIREEWPLDTHLFRVLPEERSSVTALQNAGFASVELALPQQSRPYLWFHRPHNNQ